MMHFLLVSHQSCLGIFYDCPSSVYPRNQISQVNVIIPRYRHHFSV
jgi:hypothetical protein